MGVSGTWLHRSKRTLKLYPGMRMETQRDRPKYRLIDWVVNCIQDFACQKYVKLMFAFCLICTFPFEWIVTEWDPRRKLNNCYCVSCVLWIFSLFQLRSQIQRRKQEATKYSRDPDCGCLRIKCWCLLLDLLGTKLNAGGRRYIIRSFTNFTFRKVSLGWLHPEGRDGQDM